MVWYFILISFPLLVPVSHCSVALINHSCLPSVIVTYDGTSAEVRAVKDMKPGDEVRKRDSCLWRGGGVWMCVYVCMWRRVLCLVKEGSECDLVFFF